MGSRTEDFFWAIEQLPQSFWKVKNLDEVDNLEFDYQCKELQQIPEYKRVWDLILSDTKEIESIVGIFPLAIEKKTGRIVGAVMVLPDIFQVMKGVPVHRFNADTSLIDLEFQRLGIYKRIADLPRITTQNYLKQNIYVEGGQVFWDNPAAVKAFFPNCEVIKEKYVMQKRIKLSKS